jgi:WD40 repeat protein
LIKGIGENLADNNGDNWITFNELVTYLLPAASSSIQTPGYATLPGHEQGEFLFPTPKISTSGSIVVPESTGILKQRISLQQIDITGNWESKKSDGYSHDVYDVYFKFEVRGEKLLGKVIYPIKIKRILNGKIDGDEVSFDVKFEKGSYYYEGEIRGDEIHFWEKDKDGAYVEFTAKRIIDLTESLSQNSKLKLDPGHYLYLYSLDGHKGGVKSLSFGPTEGTWPTGGIRLTSAGVVDGKIENWDVATASSWGNDHIFSDEREGYGIVAYSPQIREGGVDLITVGVAKNSKELKFCSWHFVEHSNPRGGGEQEIEGVVSQVAISQNLRFTATAESDGNKKWTIKLRYSGGEPIRTLICKGEVHALAFSGDGKLLASAESAGSADTKIKLWDTETGELKRQIDTKLSAGALAFSPEDSLLACGCSKEGKINIWNVASGKLKLTFPGDHNARVTSLTFSDTGNLVASGGISSEVINLWDIATNKLYQTLDNEGPVGALAFSRDGRLLASGDAKKGMIKIWGRPKK